MDRAVTTRRGGGNATIVWGIVWFLSYFGARGLLEKMGAPAADLGRVGVALVPIVPCTLFVWYFIDYLRQGDELERRIQLEALAIAFPLAFLLLMVLALVELAMPLNPNDWSYRHVWQFLPILWLGGQAMARRRYR
ncbi:MAG TPA: hypothetical protein VGJ64_03565 [Gemmatimonadaceae bacterium]